MKLRNKTWKAAKRGAAMGLTLAMSVGMFAPLSAWAASTEATTHEVTAVSAEKAVSPAQLRSLIFDRAYLLEPTGDTKGKDFDVSGFASNHFTYRTTVYRTWDTVKIYPYAFASSKGAAITVNGQSVNGTGEYYELDTSRVGSYQVEIKVSEAGQTNTYQVEVEKVNTDYRGRVPVVSNQTILENMKVVASTAPDASRETTSREQLLKVLQKNKEMPLNTGVADQGVYWEPSTPSTAFFVVDLGAVYDVSRIQAAILPRNQYGAKAKISVSADNVDWTAADTAQDSDGITFTTVIDQADIANNTQWHQDTLRYDFNKVYPARYIKFEVTNGDGVNKLQVQQFMIFQETKTAPETYEAPEGASVPWQHEERHQYLTSGQATVIERGYPILGWMPSAGYGRDIPRASEAEEFGWDGPLFYDAPTYNLAYLEQNPNSYWGLSKAPGGNNAMPSDPPDTPDRPLVPDALLPYVKNAVSFCFGDEQGYSTGEVDKLKKWFAYTRERFPAVILHTNNRTHDEWGNLDNLHYYIQTAKPDMLTWDDYYNNENGYKKDGGGAGSFNIHNPAYHGSAVQQIFQVSGKWNQFRQAAMEGLDGTGNQPILYGQYLDSFQTNQPESVKNLIANLSVLAGQKWLNFFRVEFQYDKSFTWDMDGTPTTGLWEWAQVADGIHAMDEWTNRLNHEWLLLKKGGGKDILNTDSKYKMSEVLSPSDAAATEQQQAGLAKQKEYGIKDVSVEVDTSRYARTVKGDVAIGLASTLPGMYESEVTEWFKGASAPKSFMVLNGLVDGSTGDDETIRDDSIGGQRVESSCFKPYVETREKGTANNTRQTITISIDPAFENVPLYRLNPKQLDSKGNAAVEKVELQGEAGNKYIVADLGGGEMNVYFWATDTTAFASTQDADGKQASFAFDAYPATYWQAKEKGDKYTLENTFAAQSLETVTINENGSAVAAYALEYQKDGQWTKLTPEQVGEAEFSTIGSSKTLTLKNPIDHVTGIRLIINKTSGNALPAIYEISTDGTQSPTGTAVEVNDNDLGSALYRFEYDDKWGYREVEDGTPPSLYPRNGDGHVASGAQDAVAKFRFWGNEVVLRLRQNKMNQLGNLEIKLYDAKGAEVDASKYERTDHNDSGTVTFKLKDGQDAAYMLSVKTLNNTVELGIDGADVKRNADAPADVSFTGASAPASDPYQTYVNDKVRDSSQTAYFTFYNQGVGADGNPTGEPVQFKKDTNEFSTGLGENNRAEQEKQGWVSYIGKSYDENGGGVRTQNAANSYTLTFTGTSAQFYAGSIPWQNAGGNQYGTFSVYLDGKKLTTSNADGAYYTETNVNQTGWQWSGGMATRLIQVVTGENQDAKHTITITNTGINRIDYAVVGKQTQEFVAQPVSHTISAKAAENGSVAATAVTAQEGSTVSVVTFPKKGYQLKEGSVKATAADGSDVPVTKHDTREGWHQFVMPTSDVVLSAEFEPKQGQYAVSASVDGNQGGDVKASTPSVDFLGDAVFEITPDEGYHLSMIRVNNIKKALPETTTYTITGVSEDIHLIAYFEQDQPQQYTVSAEFAQGQGFLTPSTQTVEQGKDAFIEYKTGDGQQLASVSVNGKPYPNVTKQENGASFVTVHEVMQDSKVVLTLAQDSLAAAQVEAKAQGGGTVWPNVQTMVEGFDGAVLFAADAGYYAKEALYNGKSYPITEADQFVLPSDMMVAGQTVVTIVFEKQTAPTYDVQIQTAAGGTIAAEPAKASEGEKVRLTVTPQSGYTYNSGSIAVLTNDQKAVNVTTVEADRVFEFTMPASHVKVSAAFTQTPVAPVEKIEITPQQVTLTAVGQTAQLTAKVSPNQMAVEWKSADPTIATVNANGLVTACANGTTTIFATAGGVTAPCTVQVTIDESQNVPHEVQVQATAGGSITANPTNAMPGETVRVTLTAQAGYQYVENSIQVSTLTKALVPVTVVQTGKVFEFTMPAAAVQVIAAFEQIPTVRVERIEVTPNQVVLNAVGATAQLTAKVYPNQMPVTWRTSNPEVATVDANGLVTAVANGTATISALTDGKAGQSIIQVAVSNNTAPSQPGTSQPTNPHPQTGDHSNLAAWAILMTLCAFAAAILCVGKKFRIKK